MPTRAKSPGVSEAASFAYALDATQLPALSLVEVGGHRKLELRHMLGMAREAFGRLVDVSVRTLAAVESKGIHAEKLQRNYAEVKRLCDALAEVMEPAQLGPWLCRPNAAFNGLKPLEIIERGEMDRLWEMCFRLRSGLPT
jgi:DNA-binding XRE family transcriptional regulator